MARWQDFVRLRKAGRRRGRRLPDDQDGAVLAETIIILPIMIVFLVGISEFGLLLFAKLNVETGLRDASRYFSRCTVTFNPCTQAMAQRLAVFGNTAGNGAPRVQGWSVASVTFTQRTIGTETFWRATTQFNYTGSPLIAMIGLNTIQVAGGHEDRFYGW